MQIVNNTIFDSTVAASGQWRNISNFVALSIHLINLEGNVTIEVSNDPNVLIDGSTIAAPAAPTISSVKTTPPASNAATYLAKVTYVTAGGGETTASVASSSQVVANPDTLQVNSPAADAGGFAVAYNVYLSTDAGVSYHKQRINFEGETGPIPLGKPFLLYAFDSKGITTPAGNTSGTPAAGIAITPNLFSATVTLTDEIAIFRGAGNATAMVNPSCLAWNYIRVVKTGGGALETQAFLFGQNG